MPPKLPPHVNKVKSRGKDYYYFHRHRGTGEARKPIRLPNDPRSPEFWTAYAELMDAPVLPEPKDTVSCLIKAWQASPEWEQMGKKTKTEWRRYCGRIEDAWGPLEVRGIEPKHVLELRDGFSHKKASANNLLRCLTSMLSWSIPRGWRPDNPCREVKKFPAGDGYEPWPTHAIAEAQEVLRQDLWWAVALALYTGQRLGDVLSMRWDHIKDGRIAVKQEKTNKRLFIRIHEDLAEILAQVPRSAVTILTSTNGTPWTQNGFQATWNKNRPPLVREYGLVFHGLRKSAVINLLEAGCSDAEVSAVTGQSRKMVEHYAKRVNQAKLADAAILKLERDRT